jgi:hypothetical protein
MPLPPVFVGGALLRAYTDVVVAKAGQPVNVFARLEANGISSIPMESVAAQLKGPSGPLPALPMQPSGDSYAAHFTPQEPGLYAVDVVVKAKTSDGTPLERTGFLVVQVEQSQASSGNRGRLALLGVGVGLLLLCALGVLFLALVWMWVRGRRGAAARG